MSDMEEGVREVVHQFLLEVANDLVNEIKKQTPVDTGRLRQSWQLRQPRPGDLEIFMGSNVDYARAIEEGAGPHTPDWESIRKWTRRKLGGDDDRAMAVFRKIQERGTKPQWPVKNAIREMERRY